MLVGAVIVEDDALDISLAFACLMAAYIVYGIQYPNKIRNILIIMEHFVFDISESDKILHMVRHAANVLCA